jgi:hypothetical protein
LLINNTNNTCVGNGYHDFTNINVDLEPGANYTLKVTCGYGSQQVRGWIDVNGNNTFDSNEMLISFSGGTSETTTTFTVPQDCEPGMQRFRLRTSYNTAPGACTANTTWGQTHDYSVTFPELYPRAKNVEAVFFNDEITITWQAPEEGTPIGYNIYREGNRLNTSLLEVLTFTDDNVNISEGVYVYNVTAVYEGNKESYAEMSNIICIYFVPTLCESPVDLDVVLEDHIVIVTWNEPENIDGELMEYEIYRNEEKLDVTIPYDVTEYHDEELPEGIYVYQVAAIYGHCESELTEGKSITIVGINETLPDSFQLFPNPATNEITIKGNGIDHIEIYDMAGKKLASLHLIATLSHHKIDVSHLSAGLYFVKIISEYGVVIKKVVVEK